MREWAKNNPEELRRRACLGHISKTACALADAGAEVTPESYTKAKRQNAPRVATIEELFGSFSEAVEAAGYSNHVVAGVFSVEHEYPVPVFDMTVPRWHNFAIGAGVFVHNCDPGWNGSVLTLELRSNLNSHMLLLTPGQKIGQIVFYAGAPVPKERSYATIGQYNGDKAAQPSRGIR
jgi:hypothetical protein